MSASSIVLESGELIRLGLKFVGNVYYTTGVDDQTKLNARMAATAGSGRPVGTF